MAKIKNTFLCEQCGAYLNKWAGQCPECKTWNSVVETLPETSRAGRFGGYSGRVENQVKKLADVGNATVQRVQTGVGELDRVLGGGIVPGAVLLLGGDPGIGKSTLLLQMIAALATRVPSLYVTGEESLEQVGMRASRLNLRLGDIKCLTETNVDQIIARAEEQQPQLMVVDSIQTAFTEELTSAPGSITQVRESAARLLRWAKERQCCVVLVGHVTKEGSLAGPRVLEHMVDAVLYFESDGGSRYRIIRAVKNRFGAVNELGMFAMTDKGLKEVSNPSAIFLSGHSGPVPGSVITIVREGTRPILLEVQALVDQSHGGNPRRLALGLDVNRLAMMLAVLHRHGGIVLADQDVLLYSSFRDRALPAKMVSFGEIGLSGEIRPVPDGQERLREAESHGYQHALIPDANAPRKSTFGLTIHPVKSVAEALDYLRGMD